MIARLRQIIPIGIVWLFHINGLIGFLSDEKDWFIQQTPLNLLVCFTLLLLTDRSEGTKKYGYILLFGVVGIFVEWLGVHFGFPFGSYTYGETLGIKLDGVPLLIGINWAMLTCITATMASRLASHFAYRVLVGGILMVFLDLFIEPSASNLDFWYWQDDHIPLSNFIGWLGVALPLHWVYQRYMEQKNSTFAFHLYFAQLLFFVVIYIQSHV